MTRQKRIDEEYKLAGGMKVFTSLTDDERKVLEDQFFVLSFVRESGDIILAAEEAKIPFNTVGKWLDTNTLDFSSRYNSTRQKLGFQIESKLINGLMNGEIANPSLFTKALETLLPNYYGKSAAIQETASLESLTELRQLASGLRKEEAQESEQQDDADETENTGEETPDNIVDLLKVRGTSQ